VKKWNTAIYDPTLSNHPGLVAMHDTVPKECGALALYLLMESGIIVKADDGTYNVAPNFEAKRAYLFNNVKKG